MSRIFHRDPKKFFKFRRADHESRGQNVDRNTPKRALQPDAYSRRSGGDIDESPTAPCTESAINEGKLPSSEDAFAYMPPYGKPAIGKASIKQANTESFSDRTNIKSDWVGEHRIVSSQSGDMAYEYGTLRMSSDSKSNPTTRHEEFEAVMLIVYKANGGICQQVALTMQPLEKTKH